MSKLLKYCRQFLEYVKNNLREGELIEFLSREGRSNTWHDSSNGHDLQGLGLYTHRIEQECKNIYGENSRSIGIKFNKEFYIFEIIFHKECHEDIGWLDFYSLSEVFRIELLEDKAEMQTTANQQETPKETSTLLDELLEQYKEAKKQIEEEASISQPETDSYRKEEELIDKILEACPIKRGDVVYCVNDQNQTLCKVVDTFVAGDSPHVRARLNTLFSNKHYNLSINTNLLVKQPQNLDCSC